MILNHKWFEALLGLAAGIMMMESVFSHDLVWGIAALWLLLLYIFLRIEQVLIETKIQVKDFLVAYLRVSKINPTKYFEGISQWDEEQMMK